MTNLNELFEREKAKEKEWIADIEKMIEQKPKSKCLGCFFEDCRCNPGDICWPQDATGV